MMNIDDCFKIKNNKKIKFSQFHIISLFMSFITIFIFITITIIILSLMIIIITTIQGLSS